jgi:protein arginine kinase
MKEKTNLPDAILNHIPWDKHSNPIWPATSFFLHRNISKYQFAHKLNEAQSLQVLDILKPPLLHLSELKNPLCLKAEELSALEKEFLCEHFLCKEGWQNASKGLAFILDHSAHFLAVLNFQDHLLLQWVDCKNAWEKAWEALNTIETSISQQIDYAFSPRFGYLTADPHLCGTGLLVMCYLHLPALISSNQLVQVLDSQKEESVLAHGMLGHMEELVGDFIILQNKFTLGLTEESILRDLHLTATKLILSEKTLRHQYKENNPPEMKDIISRSYGLLMHSYQLQTKEALNAISKIKLGIDLGWIKGITDDQINEIFFRCRRAHLSQSHQEISLNKKELAHTRAEFLHSQLKQTILAI